MIRRGRKPILRPIPQVDQSREGRPDAAVATPTPRRTRPCRILVACMISPDGGVRVLVSHLEVPGARLRYEVSGAGPVLLLIPGAAADAGAFDGIGPRLRDRFTVVAYDPQGTCRSPQLGPPSDITVQVQADDVKPDRSCAPSTDSYDYCTRSSTSTGYAACRSSRGPRPHRSARAAVAPLAARESPCRIRVMHDRQPLVPHIRW
jgi:hypothetical protein